MPISRVIDRKMLNESGATYAIATAESAPAIPV